MINRQADYDSAAVVLLLCTLATPAAGGIVNGDFQAGDLTGWTASAIDGAGAPVTPLIFVGMATSSHFASFDTGAFASGPFISLA